MQLDVGRAEGAIRLSWWGAPKLDLSAFAAAVASLKATRIASASRWDCPDFG
jgi:hypothetical protein